MLFISRLNGFVCKIVYLAGAQARNRAGNGNGHGAGSRNFRGGPQFIVWTFRNVNDLIDFGTLRNCVGVYVCVGGCECGYGWGGVQVRFNSVGFHWEEVQLNALQFAGFRGN